MWIVIAREWSFDHLDIVAEEVFGPFESQTEALQATTIDTGRYRARGWRRPLLAAYEIKAPPSSEDGGV